MRKRMYQPHLYLNEEEYQRLQELGKKLGLNMNGVIRELITGTKLMERPSRDYNSLRASVDRIGNNINQIAHMVNVSGDAGIEEIKAVQQEMKDLKREIKTWENEWL